MPENITLAQVIRAAQNALKAGLHTSLPGVVKSYDAQKKTADIQPVIKVPVYDPETGEPGEAETLPVIPNVPVSMPRGGGFHLSFPLEAGDHVTLVFSESATGQWRTSGEVSEPGDVRRHSLGYPTAFPGAHPDADVLTDDANPLFSGKLVIGKDGDPTSSVRIGGGSVECGGALPLPLAMGPAAVTLAGALATGFTAIATAFTALATAFTAKATATPAEAVGIWTPAATASTTAATACTTAATACTTAAGTLAATVTKGQ